MLDEPDKAWDKKTCDRHWNGARVNWVGTWDAARSFIRLITMVSGDPKWGGIIWAKASNVLGVGCTEVEAVQ